MTTGTLAIDRGVLPTTEVVARVHRIQEVMRTLMKEGTHFGTIPGTPKPTLYKPGAEMLLMTFRIAASPSLIEDLATPDEIRYRVTVRGTNQQTGEIIGEMVGECSSNEEKYRWRKPVCDEEFEDTPADRRREKWVKGYNNNPASKQKQVRTSPADVANTILKMATKRALIAMTLVALGASDIFAQDLEDLTEELRESVAGEAPKETKQPQRKSQATNGKPANIQDAKTITGIVEKVWRPKDKKYFAVKIKGDERLFTNWFDKFAQVEADAQRFKGTDVRATLSYTQTGDFFNVVGIVAADEPAPAQTSPTGSGHPPAASDPADTAGDLWGGREPGSDG